MEIGFLGRFYVFKITYSAWWQPKWGSNLVLNTNFAW